MDRFMRGTRFLRAVLELACECELEPLLSAAMKLAARATRTRSAWVAIPTATAVIRRAQGEPARLGVLEVRCCVLGRDGAIGVARAEPFSDREREQLRVLARILALVAAGILHDEPGVPLGEEIRALRRRRIARALDRHANNAAAAARELGVARSHVYNVRRSLLRSNSMCPR
jgi:hypothetical protein